MLSEIKNRLLHKTLVAVQDTVRVATQKMTTSKFYVISSQKKRLDCYTN